MKVEFGYVVVMEWKPIETAPKDGTEILVRDDYLCFSVARYDPEVEKWYARADGCDVVEYQNDFGVEYLILYPSSWTKITL